MNQTLNEQLLDFIHRSPSMFHAIASIRAELDAAGYMPLLETEAWHIKPDGKYYTVRNGSSLIAFQVGRDTQNCSFRIAAAHSDSPVYKIKAAPELKGPEEMLRLNVEAYGGMIDSTWLDRPLSVAGRVLVRNGDAVETRLFCTDRDVVLIPNLAIHFNRDVNKGYAFNRQTDLCIPGTNSTVKKIAFSAKKSDGFNPSLTICDEVASWEGDKGLRQYEVMKSAMGARDMSPKPGILLSCSTAGYVSDGIYDELVKRSTHFLQGDSKERRLLPLLYMIDDVQKWNDINELQKSNPNLGVSVSVDYLLEEIAIAEGSLSKKREFICKYANLKQSSSAAWLSSEDVAKCCGEHFDAEDLAHNYAVVGVDLSQSRDLTACVCVVEKSGELYVLAHFWLPAEKMQEAIQRDGVPYDLYMQRGLISPSGENFVDYHDCFNWITNLVQRYEILPLKVGYDRYSADYLTQDLKNNGFQCDDVFQGDNLYGVMQETQGIIEDGKLHIGDNDLLKMHFLDSAVKMNNERGRGRLVKVNNSRHIDGMAALLDAMTVRQKWAAEIGEQLRNERG